MSKEKLFNVFNSSNSELKRPLFELFSRPSFYILSGPFLLMIGILFYRPQALLMESFLPFVAALGYLFSWKYSVKGAFYSFGLVFFSLIFLWFLEPEQMKWSYQLLAAFTFLSSFFVVGFSSKNFKEHQQEKAQSTEKKLYKMQESYQINQKHLENHIEQVEYKNKNLEKCLKQQEKEMISFRDLLVASKEEGEKYFVQLESQLSEIKILKEKITIEESKEQELDYYKETNKQLLRKLNNTRVDALQQKLLVADYQAQLKTKKEELTAHSQDVLSDELSNLTKERAEMKASYQQSLREYQALSQKIEDFYSIDSSYSDGSRYQIASAFEEKGKLLQEMRLDILKVEETILHLKKELKITESEGLTPGSYLAIADQECLRLEEENTLLLKLLTQLFPKQPETGDIEKEVMAELESQNQFQL
jgi:uncharacterized lipoprotein YehR (DUF1307 family)